MPPLLASLLDTITWGASRTADVWSCPGLRYNLMNSFLSLETENTHGFLKYEKRIAGILCVLLASVILREKNELSWFARSLRRREVCG